MREEFNSPNETGKLFQMSKKRQALSKADSHLVWLIIYPHSTLRKFRLQFTNQQCDAKML